jgi:predicted dehydrogenase
MPDQLEATLKKTDADLAALAQDIDKMTGQVGKEYVDTLLAKRETLKGRRKLLEMQVKDGEIDATKYGYQAVQLPSGTRPPLEELIRWRLWNRTGGGLMAELGSHQLDASGIFVSACRNDGQKVHPLSVTAVGGRYIFPQDRECEDQVFCTYEFPGPNYEKDPNKKIVVTYSSINGNGFGGYGEVVMGTKGTLILEREEEVMLFREANASARIRVAKGGAGGGPVLDTTQSGGGDAATGKKILELGPVSRGYTEEMEHFCWCIREKIPLDTPVEQGGLRCPGRHAMADAIMAITSNLAMKQKKRIEFKEEWFNPYGPAAPETDLEVIG